MQKEHLENRIQEISKAINESAEGYQRLKTMLENAANQHNALVGRLEEAKELYKALCEKELVENTESKEEVA